MKITAVKPYFTWSKWRNLFLVKIETDEGIHGWGEGGASWRETAMIGIVEQMKPVLLGRDPMEIGRIWQELYRNCYLEGGRVITGAMSAIDIALHDLVGKALNVPVYQLFGGKQREWVPVYASSYATSSEELVEKAQLLIENGWDCLRLIVESGFREEPRRFMPRRDIALQAKALTKVREALGGAIAIGIDYHHRLSVAEAATFCQMMPSGTLDWVEEPIRCETPDAYASLRQMTPVPFAIGEEFSSKWQFLPYIERGLTNYARVDVCNVGGFTEAMKVAGWCEAHYIDMMPHNPLSPICTMAAAHVGMAVPNFSWMEIRESPTENLVCDEAMFPNMLHPKSGRLEVPPRPGLGVDVDEEVVKASPPREAALQAPIWRREDGSYTNW